MGNTTVVSKAIPTRQSIPTAVPTKAPVPTPKLTKAPTPTPKPTRVPTPKPTRAPTPTPIPIPIPTETLAQIEADYKASTIPTTVSNIDKNGSTDQSTNEHFTGKILNFVKDSTGNTAGANVTGLDASMSVIQVAFPIGTDITQLNEEDLLEVWGTNQGVFSGSNAFGATIQEVGIDAQYMNDKTTSYQAGY